MKRKRPPKVLYALFDGKGELAGTYLSMKEAENDAWGPAFRPSFTIRRYEIVPKVHERILHK